MTRRIRVDSPMIYVAGPYTADGPVMRDANVRNADRVAREIVAIGGELRLAVRTFVPHRLYHDWENDPRGLGEYEFIMLICRDWLLTADAIYVIGSSPGANREVVLAELVRMPIFRNLGEVRSWLMGWKREHGGVERA